MEPLCGTADRVALMFMLRAVLVPRVLVQWVKVRGEMVRQTEPPLTPFYAGTSRGSLAPDVFIDAARAPHKGRAPEERCDRNTEIEKSSVE